MKLLPISSERTLERCKRFRDDQTKALFIASYPKSGTTWLQAICYHLIVKNLEKSDVETPQLGHISDYAPFYEVDNSWNQDSEDACLLAKYNEAHAALKCRIFNTHLTPQMLPLDAPSTRAIYVVRQARDVAFSFYHHLSNQDEASGGGAWSSFDEFLHSWMRGELPYSKWSDHLALWLSYIEEQGAEGEEQKKTLLLTYEELCHDLPSSLIKICEHLDLSLTREDIEEVAPRLSFAGMKKEADKYQPVSVGWKPGYSFLRKGVVNDSFSQFYDEESGNPTALGQEYSVVMEGSLRDVETRCSAHTLSLITSLSS